MTIITTTIKPTILISSPTATPSKQFTARLPTTFLPIRTKPLSSSSNPLSVTVKCSNNMNLPNDSSDSKMATLLAEDNYVTFVLEALRPVQEANDKVKLMAAWLRTQDDTAWEIMKPYFEDVDKEHLEAYKQFTSLVKKKLDLMSEEVRAYEESLTPEQLQRHRKILDMARRAGKTTIESAN